MAWNTTTLSPYVNTTLTNGTYPTISTTGILSVFLLLITFLFGLLMNSLYLWVLGFRMSKSVNSTWFFHFTLANLIYTLVIPFVAVYVLWSPHWILGLFFCKLINTLLSVGMYGSSFLLTVISCDRYMLVFHPVWYRRHMKPRYATVACLFLWCFACLCSSPYLVLRQLRQENATTLCYNDYSLLGKSYGQQLQGRRSIFAFRILVGYLLPLFTISFCYIKIALKMKKEKLSRSNKPFAIILMAISSFFVCWLPYHAWYAMTIEKWKFSTNTRSALLVLSIGFICFNSCFTPVLYLFVVESFKKVFKKSILSLIESALNQAFVSLKSMEEKVVPHTSSMVREDNH
ncbi:probable G-protein coupled receptor 33 [Spea bombifrons]|uniref:probable G-protein coupled receptor 33 n=1 Tax=Spea bombifrons TaxID=233779 RepID=UPI00234BE190|nr:probable G-protein coupled receptor 33 [Spea bombifrons]